MKILVVAHCFPMPDRQTGMLRFWQILRLLADRYRTVFCAVAVVEYQEPTYGKLEVERYKNDLENIGIEAYACNPHELRQCFRSRQFDAVFFEHFDVLRACDLDVAELRFWQPQARLIVDTVDVEFHRLMSRAEVTKTAEDRERALDIKRIELEVYEKADLIIATSQADKMILQKEGLQTNVEVIPVLYNIPTLKTIPIKTHPSLLFVGNFELDANVDAMLYFVEEIFPIILAELPDVRLVIAGNDPTSEIGGLASSNVEVLGYVPDLSPIYQRCAIAIVPVRWGGGLKGKVVEAMSLGLPVVASYKGVEGFGLESGHNVMVGNTAQSFGEAVIQLLRDTDLYYRIRSNAWRFVYENFSDRVVGDKLTSIFDELKRYRIKRLPWTLRFRKAARLFLDRYVLWRLGQTRLNAIDANSK